MVTRLALIDSIDKTVYDPLVNTIVDDINDKIIRDKDASKYMEYFYNKENVEVPDNVYDNSIGGSMIVTTVEISDNEDLTTSLNVYKPINKPIFKDDDIGLQITPQYISTDINLTIKYVSQSKTKVSRVLNSLKMMFNNSSYIFNHKSEYSYIIPKNVIDLMSNINMLKITPYDVYGYLESIALYNYDLATTRLDDYRVPVFRGVMTGILGNFDGTPTQITVNKEGSVEYSLEFNYGLTIQVPLAVAIKYPIIINNKKLDDIWIPPHVLASMMDSDVNVKNILSIIDTLVNEPANNIDRLCKIPTFDNWVPDNLYETNGKVRFLSILLELDPEDLSMVFNINDLSILGLDESIVNYMENVEGNNLVTFGRSIFYIELYEIDYIRDLNLFIDDDKNIRTLQSLDMTKTYHVVFSILTDTRYVNDIGDKELAMYDYLNVRVRKSNSNSSVIYSKSM